jgi:hypothetical protein
LVEEEIGKVETETWTVVGGLTPKQDPLEMPRGSPMFLKEEKEISQLIISPGPKQDPLEMPRGSPMFLKE